MNTLYSKVIILKNSTRKITIKTWNSIVQALTNTKPSKHTTQIATDTTTIGNDKQDVTCGRRYGRPTACVKRSNFQNPIQSNFRIGPLDRAFIWWGWSLWRFFSTHTHTPARIQSIANEQYLTPSRVNLDNDCLSPCEHDEWHGNLRIHIFALRQKRSVQRAGPSRSPRFLLARMVRHAGGLPFV